MHRFVALLLIAVTSFPVQAEESKETVSSGFHPNTFEVSLIGNSYTSHYSPYLGIGVWKPGGAPIYARLSATSYRGLSGFALATGYLLSDKPNAVSFFAGIEFGDSHFQGEYKTSDFIGLSKGQFQGREDKYHMGPQVGMLIGRFITLTTTLAYNHKEKVGTWNGSVIGFSSSNPINEKTSGWDLYFSAGVGFLF